MTTDDDRITWRLKEQQVMQVGRMKFEGGKENFVFNTLIFKPLKRFKTRHVVNESFLLT